MGSRELEAGPAAVVEAVLEGPERDLVVAARAALGPIDPLGQARAIEATGVGIGVAGGAALDGAEHLGDAAEGAPELVGLLARHVARLALVLGMGPGQCEAGPAAVVEGLVGHLVEAVGLMRTCTRQAEGLLPPPLLGPSVGAEWIESVIRSGITSLVARADKWRNNGGVRPRSSAAHEHSVLRCAVHLLA